MSYFTLMTWLLMTIMVTSQHSSHDAIGIDGMKAQWADKMTFTLDYKLIFVVYLLTDKQSVNNQSAAVMAGP